jgi:hypothetical protein
MAWVQLSRVCGGGRVFYVASRRWGPGELVDLDAARAYDAAGKLVAAYAEPEDRHCGPWDDSRERELRAAVEAHARGLVAECPGLVVRWGRRG